MKAFLIILWLVLGVAYFFIWDYQKTPCCPGQNKQTGKTTSDTKTQIDQSDTKQLQNVTSSGAIKDLNGAVAQNDSPGSNDKNTDGPSPSSVDSEKEGIDEKYRDIIDELSGEGMTVYFPFNSTAANLSEDVNNKLDKLINFLIEKNNISLKITGHSDSIGATEVNKMVALQRAESIRQFFINKGISGNRLNCYSEGEDSPIASNSTKEGRSLNRRIVITNQN